MAKETLETVAPTERLIGRLPKIGIRPTIDGRRRGVRESLEEVRLDVVEGADLLMVKPAVTYLDVIARVRAEHDLPLAAYHVSGEYAMVHAAAANGWIDGDLVALEQLTAVKRAGADLILTYFARDLAARL